jgi:hypothetical protein
MWRHALPPAVGVVLGVIVGVLLNLATTSGTSAAIVGVAVATLVAAGWEGWWAIRHSRSHTRPTLTIVQEVEHNAGGVVGVAGPALYQRIDVDQRAAANDGTIVGYTELGQSDDRPSR